MSIALKTRMTTFIKARPKTVGKTNIIIRILMHVSLNKIEIKLVAKLLK